MGNSVQETLDLVRKAQGATKDEIAKAISTSTGLVAFDLQAPAKNLYPVNTPIRNRIPRVGGGTGLATNWRVVKALIGSGYDSMPWVPEGRRSGQMSYSTDTKAASFVTLGEEDSITFEARNAGRGFEDLQATMAIRLLQKMMLKEELAILGGHASVKLNGGNALAAPTTGASGTGGTIAGSPTNYYVACVALTAEGYAAWRQGSSLVTGLVQSKLVTGADGKTFTVNGGCSRPSAVSSAQAITTGDNLTASVPAYVGAVAYAWYAGLTGALKLEAITTINSVKLSALAGTGQAFSTLTDADYSTNSTLAFDGLIATAVNSGSGAYVQTLATGTAGVGTVLTSSGRGSVVQIDNMLQAMWDAYQVSPSVLFMNSQEMRNVTDKVLAAGSGSLLRYFADPASGARVIAGGGGIEFYYNPFSALPGGQKIPVLLHPNLPAGTIVGWADDLPAQFKNSEVPNAVEMKTRQDYYQINWPQITRAQDLGVYTEEVLAVYAPFATAVLSNIANG